MSWSTAALLAAIVILEGARRVRSGEVVLRRPLFGTWAATDPDERRRWMLVSWLPPFWTTVVVSPAGTAQPPAAALADRLAAVRPWYRALNVLGAAVLVALVGGLPWAEQRSTGTGVVFVIGLIVLLALLTTLLSWYARRRLALPRSPAWAALSPFAAPYAAERLLEHILTPHPVVAVTRALLPAQRFREWIRPRAYDATTGGGTDPELRAALDRQELEAILAPPSAVDDAPLFCPRCGAVYRAADMCADCTTVRLRPFALP